MRLIAKGVIIAGALIVLAVVTLKGAAILIPSGTWVPQTNLSSARANASAALLQDGRVLIAGGDSGSGPVATADFFAADGTISAAPPMVNARSKHVAVTLQDGRVLVAGGMTSGGSATSTAEIYDPASNSWANVGTGMTEARSSATAALLPDGRVIIAGGQNGSSISSTIEIFDPVAGSFSSAGTMSSPRTQHAMAVLHDGRVIITGGFNGTSPVASTDIFDPVAGTISAGPSLAVARFGHSATTLLNGQVVVIGGNNGNADPAQMDLASAELFDPAAGTFSTLGTNLVTPREGHLAFLLPNNGSVLIAGGTSASAATASAELLTPQESPDGVWTYGFASTGSMTGARTAATGSANQVTAPSSVMQRNGVVMVASGNDANGNALSSTEAYGYATIQTDQGDYPPGTTVTITGSGWKPGETVTLTLVESPLIDAHGPFTTVADASGNISDSSFVTDSYDASITFTLTAAGQTSGFHAQTTFTDAAAPSVTCTPNPVNVGSASTCTATVSGAAGDHVTWTHTGSGSFDVTSCTVGGSPNFSCSVQYTPSAAGSSLLTATDGTKSGSFTVTTPANLTATKSDSVSGNLTLPANSWTWSIALANSGFADATFANGDRVLHDDLPSGLTYGAVSGAPAHLSCSIASNVLTCTVSSSTVTIAAGGGFTVSFTATDSANTVASFANPVSGGSCAVDPSNVIMEATGSNTACSDTVTVNSATVSTTTAVSSSANPSAFGQSVNFTATVTATSGTPTGKVQFKVDGSNFGGQVTLVAGVATSGSTSSLSVGNHTVLADYLGDTGFNASTGTLSGGETVNKADTTTTVTSSGTPTVFGQPVTFTATVTVNAPGSGTPSGTVTFYDGGISIGTGTLNQASPDQATLTTTTLSVASHIITATYTSGDSDFNASPASSNITQVVNKADTTTTVTSSGTPTVFGQPVTFTATVTVNAPGSGTPSGTVTFYDGGISIGTGTLNQASPDQATLTTTTLSVASHIITATYTSGDSDFNASPASSNITQVVNKADTTTTVTSSGTPTVFGQPVTFTATVTVNAPGSGTPSGTVTFYDGGISIGTGTLNQASPDQATLTTTTLSVASHIITATYTSGDSDFNASPASSNITQVVNKADTTTTVTSSGTPTVFGQPVTFTATVTVNAPGSGTPSGTVTFYDGGISIGTGTLNQASPDQATLTTTTLSVASHIITATYTSGDSDFNASPVSSNITQVVNKADTTTTVTSSGTPTVFGQPVTFTATVTVNAPGSGTPSGTVTFYDGGTSIGTGTLNQASPDQATLTTTTLSVASHIITATYTSGDSDFNASPASSNITQVVNKADTTTTVTSSGTPTVFGQPVTFTATVTVNAPGSGTPSGTVTFYDGGISIGTGTLNQASPDQATLTTSTLSVASHTITATYTSGDSDFNASPVSSNITQVVNKADTTTTVTSSGTPTVFGQPVTFTATVTVNAPGSGTPSGTVTFYDGGTSIGTGTLNQASPDRATLTTTTLSVGSHTITATYTSGDSDFNASPGSSSITQVVQYGVCLLYDPTRAVKGGATYPLKLYLCDVNGSDLSSPGIIVHATSIFMVSGFTGAPDDAGNANPDSDFRFDSTLGPSGGYIFNLKTTGLLSGTYGYTFTASNDPTTHTVLPGFGVK